MVARRTLVPDGPETFIGTCDPQWRWIFFGGLTSPRARVLVCDHAVLGLHHSESSCVHGHRRLARPRSLLGNSRWRSPSNHDHAATAMDEFVQVHEQLQRRLVHLRLRRRPAHQRHVNLLGLLAMLQFESGGVRRRLWFCVFTFDSVCFAAPAESPHGLRAWRSSQKQSKHLILNPHLRKRLAASGRNHNNRWWFRSGDDKST